jgi:hypothetical protein
MMNPDGLVDGVLLSDATIVRFPPHMSQQLVQTVKPQDLVSVDGCIECQGTIHATTITNPASQQSVVDIPPSPQNPPPGSGQEARQPMSATGTIKVLTHAARGEIDGAVLDNGTIVHFPPPVGTQFANLFQVGAPLAAVGYGTINTYGRSLEATSIGPSADHMQTVAAIDDRPRGGPRERQRPIPVPAGASSQNSQQRHYTSHWLGALVLGMKGHISSKLQHRSWKWIDHTQDLLVPVSWGWMRSTF